MIAADAAKTAWDHSKSAASYAQTAAAEASNAAAKAKNQDQALNSTAAEKEAAARQYSTESYAA